MAPPRFHRIEVLDTLFGQIHAQFETGDDLRPRALRNARGIADMVAMAMGDQDVGGAVARLLDIALESGMPVKKGSIRTLFSPNARRKAEWPYQVIFMARLSSLFGLKETAPRLFFLRTEHDACPYLPVTAPSCGNATARLVFHPVAEFLDSVRAERGS